MTIDELHELGIEYVGNKDHPRDFHIIGVGRITLPEIFNVSMVLEAIYAQGVKEGITTGIRQNQKAVRAVIGIE